MEKREYIGNSKRITLDNNRIHLRIIGNNNKIDMKTNSGHLDVIGNSSRIKIGENSGKVSYVGNSGKLYLGSSSSSKNIHYTGNDGTMKFINKDNLWKNQNKQKDQK